MFGRLLIAVSLALSLSAYSPPIAGGAELIVPDGPVPVGGLIMLRIEGLAEGQLFGWQVPNAQTADLMDRAENPILFVASSTPGTYQAVLAYVENGQVQIQIKPFVVAGQGPRPPPDDDEQPPPDDDPDDDVPPGPAGLRVLILEETADRGRLPREQLAALFSPHVRAYLNQRTAKGPDGRTPEWRVLDDDFTEEQMAHTSQVWRDAYNDAKERASTLPWIHISDGSRGESRPLPPNEAALLELLRKYGGA